MSMRLGIAVVAFALLAGIGLHAQSATGGGAGGTTGGSGGSASGGGGSSGGYAGCPAPAPSPSPAPAPAPSPSPSPSPAPTPGPGPGGATPGVGPGGATPGFAGAGAATPGGAPTAGPAGGGRGGPGRGGATPNLGKKGRFSNEQNYWLGVLKMPWDGTFLPKGNNEAGYAGTQLSVDDAIRGKGGAGAWKLKKRPTIVFVYDPSEREHAKAAHDVEAFHDMKVAANYFNLVRLDVRTIEDKALLAEAANKPLFLLYGSSGERVSAVKAPKDAGRDVYKAVSPLLEAEYGMSAGEAVAKMGVILARQAWVKDEIKRHEAVVICPDCGKKNDSVCTSLEGLRKELKDLEANKEASARVKDGAVSKAR